MSLIIGLSVVIVAYDGEKPRVLTTRRQGGLAALPFGAFDPEVHRTFELALRGWVKQQTGFQLGYVEQLYTFGDRDRERPEANLFDAPDGTRIVSVGYIAMTPEAERLPDAFEARWRGWYRHFPWEDHRHGRPALLDSVIAPKLRTWAAGSDERQSRAELAFGLEGHPWIDEAVLERYELLYEAGLVEECARDQSLPLPGARLGEPMASDHRRILATAIGRLRSKIRYRPIIFEIMPERFTLSALQRTAEAILGQTLHKQNFRRALDRTGLVEGTGQQESGTGGRPAELFRVKRENLRRGIARGLNTPVIKPG
ncbi:MAG: NAD regulator [Henriciella sp.]|nr:NAD regulator [Henriciella sp.]